MTETEVQNLFKKNPNLSKIIQKNFHEANDYEIYHIHEIIQKHRQLLKEVKLVYPQYNSFNELYNALLKVTNETKATFWNYINENDLKSMFDQDKIEYTEGKGKSIIVKIKTYEQMKKYGSKSWCIYKQESTFKSYLKNGTRSQYILFDFENKTNSKFRIGFTYSEIYFTSFDDDNTYVKNEYINNLLLENNKFKISKSAISENKDSTEVPFFFFPMFMGILLSVSVFLGPTIFEGMYSSGSSLSEKTQPIVLVYDFYGYDQFGCDRDHITADGEICNQPTESIDDREHSIEVKTQPRHNSVGQSMNGLNETVKESMRMVSGLAGLMGFFMFTLGLLKIRNAINYGEQLNLSFVLVGAICMSIPMLMRI